MSQLIPKEKNIEKDLTGLSDFDIIELYIKCVETFAESCSRLDMDNHRCFEFGEILWDRSIKARDEYRKGHSDKDPKR
jgi:hypothetical protein